MSNTSTASPVLGIAVGSVLAAAAVVSFITHVSEEEAALIAQDRQDRARETLGVTSVTLHARQMAPLVQTAERMGFTRERLSGGSDCVLLSGPGGQRLALDRDASGRVVLHGADKLHVGRLLRQHTADRIVSRLRVKGADVRVAALADGAVRIEAREADHGQRDGQVRLRAQVGTGGQCTLDVSGIRGTGCREFVEEVAQAADCHVTTTALSDEAFELPGEPTAVRRLV